MVHILVADDDKDIIRLIRLYLESDEIQVYEAYDGEMAYMILENYEIDLAIVDIMMPRMNGYELIKKVRNEMEIPILILSAKANLNDKVLGLNLGADDYITKPFEPLELEARVKTQLRRMKVSTGQSEKESIKVGELELNLKECTLKRGNMVKPLTKAEFRVLCLLMEHPGRVYTKEQIYESCWEGEYVVDDNTIRVIISRLREKAGKDAITTIRGLGYRMEKHG